MSTPAHRLSNLDALIQEGVCEVCGHVSINKNGHDARGNQKWKCAGALNSKEHRLLDADWDDKTAWCKACQRRVDFIGTSQATRLKCGPDSRRRAEDRRRNKPDHVKQVHLEWRRANATHVKNQHYKRRFGTSYDEVRQKFANQAGKCAICDKGLTLVREAPRDIRANLDHDHTTGAIRDLLCHHCNAGIGAFQDSPERLDAAARYLRRHQSE